MTILVFVAEPSIQLLQNKDGHARIVAGHYAENLVVVLILILYHAPQVRPSVIAVYHSDLIGIGTRRCQRPIYGLLRVFLHQTMQVNRDERVIHFHSLPSTAAQILWQRYMFINQSVS